ncbi:MAG: zinc ribbon domain-containing protein [Anaerolineales bacterium]|nr:zinc ribbon domain-containing protein [Anaerolineales bacterium]
MTQKDLGYVELEWTCPRCKGRNPGTQATCSTCGAAQPENVNFETPAAQAAVTTDQAKIDRAKAGPDIHCGFCGARNPADAKVCKQCGGDLTQGKAREAGKTVGAYGETDAGAKVKCKACGEENPAAAVTCAKCGAPLGKPAPAAAPAQAAPAPSGLGGGSVLIFVAIGLIVVLGLCAFVFFGFRTSEKTATSTGAHWERSVAIMGMVPVRAQAWQNQLPSNANNVSCRSERRSTSSSPQPGAREVCGTPYTVDTGTGMGRVVQDCEYEVYDDYCSYTTLQWAVVNTVVEKGNDFAPRWPAVNLTGDQKLGTRNETYVCELNDGKNNYTFTMRTQAEYEECLAGSEWKIEVDGFGAVVSAVPVN